MHRRIALHPWGMVGAAIMFVLGLTPSLLPRDFFYQGLVCGLGAGIGYLLGSGAHRVWHRWLSPRYAPRLRVRLDRVPPRARRGVRVAVPAVAWMGVIGAAVFSLRWQRGVAELTGAQAYSLGEFLLVLPVGAAVFAAALALGVVVRALARGLTRAAPSRLRAPVRGTLGWGAAIILCLLVVNEVIPGIIVGTGERVFSASNAHPEEGVRRPAEAQRSGSPDSPVDFAGLGRYGMRFVDGGLRAADLERLTGRPAREPVRVYTGLRTEPEVGKRARVLIDELERTDAREHKALLLVLPTGTGWVNLRAAQAFELLHDGDTAVASAQYSYLPSAFHFFAGGEAVQEAGRELITPVVDWWNGLPAENRPKLYLYGESLGSTAVESAFSGMRDISSSVDGILLTGPPDFNPLWSSFIERRDPGTTQVSPEYSGGLVVRFAQNAEQVRSFAGADERWGPTRVLYIQHPSDPIVWWSPSLMLKEPDWLREPAGFDRFPGMRWIPFLTFLQVAADLPVSQNVPQSHGHNYGDELLDGFVAIAGQDQRRARELAGVLEAALTSSGDAKFE
ncbi:alpha/beta-hydrolase family protein [Corynebacterium sp. zg-331]|uniref:alpha/beta hydrolase n=1 Tax=unclassified Corynebacterium TaxID=2624378 RepID=UPI00128E4D84|nr:MULTISPECIES: alpha/beta hydrolase [unclassified Corynebacterium]MBC3186870.1 alpha/beta-hydrolase family protein [Corynebacterium sp. zg-331]MPV53350.1 hypothetical protein [Corynebacterium sp. zg331]